MLIRDVAIHVRKNSKTEPEAKFSIYFQPTLLRFGISRRTRNGAVRILLIQKLSSSRWHLINMKGVGLKNDEAIG